MHLEREVERLTDALDGARRWSAAYKSAAHMRDELIRELTAHTIRVDRALERLRTLSATDIAEIAQEAAEREMVIDYAQMKAGWRYQHECLVRSVIDVTLRQVGLDHGRRYGW